MPGQSRRDLLATNTGIIARASLEIRKLYEGLPEEDLPILIYMGNPVTTMNLGGMESVGLSEIKDHGSGR